MATAKKNKNGTWEITVYVGKLPDGKRIYKHLTGKSKAEVLEKARAYQDDETPQTTQAGSMTVRQAVDKYIERRDAELSPSTIAKYKSYRDSSFLALQQQKIADLTDAYIQSQIDDYAKGHSPKSTLNRWNLIKAAIKEVKMNFKPHPKLPSAKRIRLEMPDKDTMVKLFDAVEGTGLEIPVYLAAVCGLRRGEICALDLSADVDYNNNLIHVNKDMVLNDKKEYVIKPPKTDAANRTIPAPAWLIGILKVARDNPNYKMYLPNTVTTKFHALAQNLGINCSFHGLRHYFVSVMTSLGIPDLYQMERLGHTTSYTTDRYKEFLKEKTAEVNDDLIAYFDGIKSAAHSSNA